MCKYFPILTSILLIATLSFAQKQTPNFNTPTENFQTEPSGIPFIHNCDAHVLHQQKMDRDPGFRERSQKYHQRYLTNMRKLLEDRRNGLTDNQLSAITIIPVVVHVMHLPGTSVGVDENISMAQIEQGITDLNAAYSNTGDYAASGHNASIPSIDTEFQFCLAKQDPSGNPTDGVNRIATNYSTLFRDDLVSGACGGDQDGALKDLSRWNPDDYLNIWLVKEICRNSPGSGCGVAGYAYTAPAHGACYDGVVNEADYFGSSTSNSKVHIHEVGHYLNLRHTWGTGSSPDCTNNDCLNNNDFVCDTPPDGSTSGTTCNNAANSCGTDEDDTSTNNPYRPAGMGGMGDQDDNYENYMDYSYQSCQNTFTQGQKDRMNDAMTNYRSSLNSSVGCTMVGATNQVHFKDGGATYTESSVSGVSGCRGYLDVDIELTTYNRTTGAISLTANVLDGTGHAIADADFYGSTSTPVVIADGSDSETVTLRIYDDAAVEGSETVTLTFSVGSGGTASSFNTTFTVTIEDNDNSPSGTRPVLFSDDFESGSLSNWSRSYFTGCSTDNWWETGTDGDCMDGSGSAYISNDGGINNAYDNINSCALLYANVDATGYTGLEITFDYIAGGDGTNDWGRLIGRTTSGSGVFSYLGSTFSAQSCPKKSETFSLASGYDNKDFDLGFVWNTEGLGSTQPSFTVDNVEVTADPTGIESTLDESDSQYLGPYAIVYFYGSAGNLITKIENLSDHDYGCTTVTVDRAGSSSSTGGGSLTTYDYTNKTFLVTPSINNPAGEYNITLYYTEAEIAGWETGSGDVRSNLNVIKSTGSIASSNETNSHIDASTSVAAFGADHGYQGYFATGFSGLAISNVPASALPVELAAFTGRKEGENVVLNWKTENELNNDYFTLERSTDGRNFEMITLVDGAGTTYDIHTYQYLDKTPRIGANYYRLLQTDFDGQKQYIGDIVVVDFNSEPEISIRPNPVKFDQLNLSYISEETIKDLEVSIISISGEILQKAYFDIEKGRNNIRMDIHRLGGGMYIMKTIQGNATRSLRFVKAVD